MSVIPLVSGKSYIMTNKPIKQETYKPIDELGRTPAELKFVNQFEKIFYAAAWGDVNTCKQIVNEGFDDFYAYSIGRFTTFSGKPLDNMSPLQIATFNQRLNVIAFFILQMSKNGAKSVTEPKKEMPKQVALTTVTERCGQINQPESQPQNSQIQYYAQLNHEEKKQNEADLIKNYYNVQIIEFLKKIINESFNHTYPVASLIEMMALVDYLETFNKS
jgi:hypothetical protein